MKVWQGYGSEHSSNLVIIGEFKTEADATEARRLIEGATEIVRRDLDAGRIKTGGNSPMTTELKKFLHETNQCYTLGSTDQDNLLYDYDMEQTSKRVVITIDESEILAFIKGLLHKSAMVQVYSAHSHKSDYGRQTYEGD